MIEGAQLFHNLCACLARVLSVASLELLPLTLRDLSRTHEFRSRTSFSSNSFHGHLPAPLHARAVTETSLRLGSQQPMTSTYECCVPQELCRCLSNTQEGPASFHCRGFETSSVSFLSCRILDFSFSLSYFTICKECRFKQRSVADSDFAGLTVNPCSLTWRSYAGARAVKKPHFHLMYIEKSILENTHELWPIGCVSKGTTRIAPSIFILHFEGSCYSRRT